MILYMYLKTHGSFSSGEWDYSYDFPSDFITLDLIMANTLIIMQQSKTVS